MSGSSMGVLFKVTTWGESHGAANGCVIEGCPPLIDLSEADIQTALDRRKPGQTAFASPRREPDTVEILSGVFEGKTTGTPILLLIRNRDAASSAYDNLRDVFRPGHGDFTYLKKYGIRDHRGGGRASGRETVSRVAAGAVAEKITHAAGISVLAYTKMLGGIYADPVLCDPDTVSVKQVVENRLYCPDPDAARHMEQALEEAKAAGDSLGGIVEIVVRGCPPGLGEPVFDKMDADLAKALMGIGAVKGVEIGAGFAAAGMKGFEANDPILPPARFFSNHAGGILAGITNGADIILRAACKPISSIEKEQQTIDIHGAPAKLSVKGRHDVSVIPRIIPVCEAMVQIVLADHLLRQKAVAG
ncbi:MAG: chorismate synthase [Deltaproteobacteria bacterium]|nr:chorismate synthase [Deltaproteobacteria bacterium]